MAEKTHTCAKCGFTKPLTSFPKSERCRDGRASTCHRCKHHQPPSGPPSEEGKKFRRSLKGSRFLITAAQNGTPVHPEFWETLKRAASFLKAEIVVIPLRYKNPTSQWTANQEDSEWWDVPENFLFDGRKKLCDNLLLVADVKVQPTASSPLSGFDSLSGAESCIIGHPKMQFKTIAVPSGKFPKILTTTGVCTLPNYTDSKAGKIGEFHHYLGALLVEVEGKKFHLRQVNADRRDGSFTDLDKHFTPGAVFEAPPAAALVMGDTHVSGTDSGVDEATFGPSGIVEFLHPQKLIFHDLFDGETVNPHEVGDLFLASAKQKAGRQDVRAELQQVVDFLKARSGTSEVVIVDSNHHDFLRRWVLRNLHCGCHDAKNLGVFLESAKHMHETSQMTAAGPVYGDPFQYWISKFGGPQIRCLSHDESITVEGIECGLHGHHGPSGSKGTIKNLSRLGVRSITGHGHAPGIEEGHYRVGTSTPRRQAYQRGPSANLNTHCVIYATGKRALITIIDRKWRAP